MQLNLPVNESGPKLFMASIINPREPPELNGRSIATGNESVISFDTPINLNPSEIQPLIISKSPLFLKREIATNIPNTYGKIVTPVLSPLFAPTTNESKTVVFFSLNFRS